MSSGPQFLDIIILFVIAVLLISRLRSVLGSRNDDDNSIEKDDFNKNKNCCSIFDDAQHSNIIDITPAKIDENKIQINPLLAEIIENDSSFEEQEFIEGAKIAFEMIIKAYADNDFETLENLLANEVLKSFIDAIENRKINNQTMECQLIGFNDVQIISSELIKEEARITIKFASEQINIIKDSDGNVVAGDSNYIESITDIWTFARDITSKNPNWKLVATRSS